MKLWKTLRATLSLVSRMLEFDGAGTVGADHSGKEKTEHSDKSQSQSTSDVRRSIEFAKSKPAMPPVAEEESKPVSLGPESKKSENTATQVVDLPGQSKKDEAANEALLKPVSSNVSIASASTEKSSPDFIPANEVSPNAVMDLPSGMEDPWLERDSQRQNVNTQDNWLESLTDQSTDNGWTVVGEAELTTRQTAYNDSSTQSNENASSASPGVEVTLSDKPAASKPPVSQPRRRASNRSVSSLSAEQSSRQLYGRASSSSISTLASRQSHRNSLPSGPPDPLGAVAAVVDSLSGSIARVVRKTPIGVYPFAGDADPLS
ncbi:hypothetical protein BJ742DRAFT_299594 [Cladochytrium replicatum]|nr:hypothetical protein BJ742DRAFT_299594 [Cladochytrium replicatum]